MKSPGSIFFFSRKGNYLGSSEKYDHIEVIILPPLGSSCNPVSCSWGRMRDESQGG